MIHTINSIVSLNIINLSVSVMEMQFVFIVVGNEF